MIEFKNVGKIYPNGVEALKNVSLKIDQGEFVAIIGLSGAGKSTMLRVINKMHEPTTGEMLIDGVDIAKLKGKELRKLRRKIGMVFQTYNLINRTTVFKNVLASRVADMPFLNVLFGIYRKKDKLIALEALERVGILEKAFMRADQLSGGQQQRVALARTLAQQPSIILADEPVAALDPITAHQIMDDFKRVNQELGIPVLANMHHVDLALEYATRVIGIKAGVVVYDGPADQVDEALLEEIYGRGLTEEELLGDE